MCKTMCTTSRSPLEKRLQAMKTSSRNQSIAILALLSGARLAKAGKCMFLDVQALAKRKKYWVRMDS
jgi:hypothetical protein